MKRLPNGQLSAEHVKKCNEEKKQRLTSFGFATAKDNFKELYDFTPEMKGRIYESFTGSKEEKLD